MAEIDSAKFYGTDKVSTTIWGQEFWGSYVGGNPPATLTEDTVMSGLKLSGSSFTVSEGAVLGIENGTVLSGHTTASISGVALYAGSKNTTVLIDGSTISENYTATNELDGREGDGVSGAGGAIFSEGVDSSRNIMSVSDTLFYGNTISKVNKSGYGGAITASYTNLTVSGSTFTENVAYGGAAIYVRHGANSLTGNLFSENHGANGALALYNGSTNTVSGNRFFNNDSTNSGGAIYVTCTSANISGNTFYDNVAKGSGGKVESNLVGGAYVSAGNTAAVGKVELLIGGTAELVDGSRAYAGGYLYGNAGDAKAAAEAQLTVGKVNVNLTGGTVGGNLYGGAHARQNGNVSVTKVNITVTDGSHSRIYAGGWAEKGAVSSVGTSTVIISGGTVDYLYGAGANADGKTYVTTSNITISGAAEVNTIFMGGRYGYSWVNNVSLTFDGEAKTLKRLSGVSSAGMDYSEATVVELETNVTADLIDYVDKFVINEDCLLTAKDAFYLGNRVEGSAKPGVTTFDFITDGLDKEWTAVAGIDDFTNAQFSVNGEGLTTWDGESVKTIGGYNLTYDATDKTIKLAQITA